MTRDDGSPNLDAMELEDVRAFAVEATRGDRPIRLARELFPARQKGYVRITLNLGHYAWNKVTAMQLRLCGSIARAGKYERICDQIYDELPEWARW